MIFEDTSRRDSISSLQSLSVPSDFRFHRTEILPRIEPAHNKIRPSSPGEARQMPNQENSADVIADLERRIDTMQNMSDSELGTFHRFDWIVLIVFSIVIPVIVVVLAR